MVGREFDLASRYSLTRVSRTVGARGPVYGLASAAALRLRILQGPASREAPSPASGRIVSAPFAQPRVPPPHLQSGLTGILD